MVARRHLSMTQFGWWVLALVGAVFVTGPILVLGPLGLALVVIGGGTVLGGITTKKGMPRRAPLVALGVVWLVVGIAVLVDTPIHTSVGGTGVIPLHHPRAAFRGPSPP
jgi:hypothetical protein